MSYDYDLFVIGAGPAGIAASKQAAACGARVAIAEQEAIGGTCVNRGCVPKKFIVYAADFALQERSRSSYGWSECERHFDWQRFMTAVHQQVQQRQQSFEQSFQKAGINLLPGHATLVDPHTVEIDNSKYTADKILIAVGGKPQKPKIPGVEHGITSRQMFQLPQLPKKLVIVGGGYIGVEFSSMMNAFGVQVTLIETGEAILSGFDDDVRSAVQDGLSQRGIQFFCDTSAQEIKHNSQGLEIILSGDRTSTITADTLLIATGRKPNTNDLGLENAGVELNEKGAIRVDDYHCTTQENIYAVGDCASKLQLTPVARTQGRAIAQTLFGDRSPNINYDYVPSAVFCRPEAASVGMTEAKAREKLGDSVQCLRTQFEPLFYSMTNQKEQAMMKVVVDGKSNRVLGAHMVGEHAADIIQSLAVAVQQGITQQDLVATMGIHPTTGEEFLLLD